MKTQKQIAQELIEKQEARTKEAAALKGFARHVYQKALEASIVELGILEDYRKLDVECEESGDYSGFFNE